MTPEGRVKAAVRRELLGRGFWQAGGPRPPKVHGWFYMPVSNGMGVHGIPDFVCCWGGLTFVIETKAPGRRRDVSSTQKDRLEELQAAGALTLVCDDVAQLKEFMDEHDVRADGGA